MSLFEILVKRYEFEQLVSFRKTFDLPSYEGDINNLKYFINNGHKNNRFRKNFNRAMELANEIVKYYGSMETLDKRLER